MQRKRSVMVVKMLLDPVPGWGHVPEDRVRWLQQHLTLACPWYEPKVELVQVEEVESNGQ